MKTFPSNQVREVFNDRFIPKSQMTILIRTIDPITRTVVRKLFVTDENGSIVQELALSGYEHLVILDERLHRTLFLNRDLAKSTYNVQLRYEMNDDGVTEHRLYITAAAPASAAVASPFITLSSDEVKIPPRVG